MTSSSKPSALPEALTIAEPMVAWLLRSGVSYGELAQALKLLFLTQALKELAHNGQRDTDSALSLLSGLHRKDVRALRDAAQQQLQGIEADRQSWSRPSLASQVATRWLADADCPDTLSYSGPAPSFEHLVRSISQDVHPRTVQQELLRLGLVERHGEQLTLLRQALVPQADQQEMRHLLAASVADHLHAGVHNLTVQGQGKFLEQSVFADGLSAESVRELQQLSNQLWQQALSQMALRASALCAQDEKNGLTPGQGQRFRLGMFSYHAPEGLPAGAQGSNPAKANTQAATVKAAKAEKTAKTKKTDGPQAPPRGQTP